jgi:hypothetical protein
VQSQLSDEFTLRSSVALAKWMKCVELSKIVSGTPTELRGLDFLQNVLRSELVAKVAQFGRDMLWPGEKRIALGDRHGAKFSSPVVDILEKILVDAA